MGSDNRRTLYYDFIRVVACFLVIVNHTYNYVFFNSFFSKTWIASGIIFYACKVAVPLFLMLSGALLLGREERYVFFLKNRVLKIFISLVSWSIIYRMITSYSFFSLSKIVSLLKGAISNPVTGAYWYLYLILGLYLVTPLIRKMLKNFTNKDYLYFFILWFFISGVLPFINIFYKLKITNKFELPIVTGYIGFYVLGYYLNNILISKKHIMMSWTVFIFNLFINLITTYNLSIKSGITSKKLDGVLFFTTILMSLSVFILIKYYISSNSDKINNKLQYMITQISSVSFGIYLIHVIVLRLFSELKISKIIVYNGHLNIIISMFVYDILVLFTSYFFITLLRKIPCSKMIT